VCNLYPEVTALGYKLAIEEFLSVRHIQFLQQSDSKLLTVDLLA
jgi:hypothetical protein